MSKYIKTKDNRDNLDELYKKINRLNSMKIHIGIFSDTGDKLLMIARVQEYGVKIEVTDKMRGYLASQGLFLRGDTQYITIPERSYVRSTAIDKLKDIQKNSKKYLNQIITTNMKVETFGKLLGNVLADIMKEQMKELKNPKLHPFTIEQKGSDDPLIDTGELLNAITYKVVT